MKIPKELFFAYRFIYSQKDKNIHSMLKICFLSIFIGSAALTLIHAIMNGFQLATHKKLQGIHSDLIIQSPFSEIDFDKLKYVLESEYSRYIKIFSPSAATQALVANKKKNEMLHDLVIIKGIDPISEAKVTSLKKMMIATLKKDESWSKLLDKNSIFIGESLAQFLGITIGATIDLLYSDEEKNDTINLQSKKVIVAGIFKTGINEFDEHIIFCSLSFFEEIFSQSISEIHIKLRNPKEEKIVIDKLKKRTNLLVYSWKDLYPALLSALKLEKYASFIILALVAIVAAMNLISLLYMFIIQKTRQIAVLKAMGMTSLSIMTVFILTGIMISLFASLLGIVGGIILSWIIDSYKLISLPDVYYVTYLPAKINIYSIILIIVAVIFLSLFISIIPARKIKNISIPQILKNG